MLDLNSDDTRLLHLSSIFVMFMSFSCLQVEELKLGLAAQSGKSNEVMSEPLWSCQGTLLRQGQGWGSGRVMNLTDPLSVHLPSRRILVLQPVGPK